MMNMQEMQTIRTNNLPVRVFMICNGGYHSIRQTQNAYFGKPLIGIGPESGDLSFPDTGKIADCFGFSYGECVSNETIAEDLARAMELPLPALIRVEVTTTQKTEPKAASRKLADGTMVSSPLEDMAPFLSREELRANMLIPLTPDEDTD
jgi:acetolactate synthase-1/2/3 large subunit